MALVAILGGATVLAGCGAQSASDVQTVATAIRELETKGAQFQMSEVLTQTGGDIPKGKQAYIKFAAGGAERDDNAYLVLKLSNARNQPLGGYDLVINDSDLYVRPHGSTRIWYSGPAAVANHFYPGVRLNLLRDTVLLAAKQSSKGPSYSNGSFVRQYTIVPGADQLEQLQSTVVAPGNEGKYLKSASGSIDFFIGLNGNHLERVNIHLVGTDPDTSLRQEFRSSLVFSKLGKVPPVAIPTKALPVPASNLFSTAQPSTG
ncbi:MAG: hypothetical protein M3Z13_06445 [Candidatus Dormibacteraeota bacterium]|nr:hypothetical protein [Candidatus Dormibacteraeota bacterium]